MANEPELMIPITLDSDTMTVRPERADAQENRARILAAAAALFQEHGVNHVNMVDIARKAEVGQGTLYRRFASKGDLCLALLDTQMREFQEATFAELRTMVLAHCPYVEQLAWFIDAWIGFQAHHSLLLCAVTQDQPLDNHPQSPPFLWQRMTVHGLLRRAAAAGELATDVDVQFSADAILALLQPDTLRLQQEIGGHTTQQMVAGIQRLLRGISKP
jgi:AcrR family transcriptional regulator